MKEKLLDLLLTITLLVLLVCGCVYLYGYYNQNPVDRSLGSVTQGNEHNSTSTPFDVAQSDGLIDQGYGTLGQVTVTSVGDLTFRLLDATTTVATNRPAARQATSSAELAVINTASAGTFTFDVVYYDGLYLDVISGTNGTTTVTYR